MLSLLRTLLLFSLLSSTMLAQAVPPDVPLTHLDSLYEHEVGDTARIGLAYRSATAPAAAPQRMHAASWMSVYLLHEEPWVAIKWAEKALALAKTAGLDSLDYRLAPAYHTLGWLSNEGYGDHELARRGIRIAPPGGHLGYRLYSQVAALLVLECDPYVLVALDSARQMLRSFDEETQTAELYGSILYEKAGFLHQCQENFRGSAEVYQVMIDHYAKDLTDPENLNAWVVAKASRGLLLAEMQNLPAAKQLMEELDALPIDSLGLYTYDYANVQNSLGVIAEALGQVEKAFTYEEKTLAYYQQHKEETMGHEFEETYLQLLLASAETPDNARTARYLTEYRQRVARPEMRYYQTASDLLYRTGNYQASLDTATLALRQVCADCPPGELPTSANTINTARSAVWYLQAVAQLYFNATRALDRLARSADDELKHLREAIALEDKLLGFYTAVEQEEQGLFGESALVVTDYKTAALNAAAARHARLQTLTGSAAEVAATFRMIEAGKSSIAKQELDPAVFPETVVTENKRFLRALREKEIELATRAPDETAAIRQAFVATTEAYQLFRNTLNASYPALVAQQQRQRNVTLAGLQRALRPDDVFLHYVKTITKYDSSQLLIQAITPARVLTVSVAAPADLDKLIGEYQRLIQSPLQRQRRKQQRFVELSHLLYGLLIEPVSEMLTADARLIVSPDKALYYVPFESLVESAAPAAYADLPYLIKRHAISYHFSATDFVAARHAGAKQVGVAAFAPVFARGGELTAVASTFRALPDSLLRGLSANVLDPLPATRQEVNNIQGIYGEETVTLKTDGGADRETLLSMLSGDYKVVHVATHGFVNEANYGLSALACYAGGGLTPDFVYAYDIRNQEVTADLVILSSCESGIGRAVSGEGLLSLNRALVHAGARNVISTLWKIDDRYSSEFMTKFHRKLVTGTPYAPALRAAKLQMIEAAETSSPRFWAPFVLVGS